MDPHGASNASLVALSAFSSYYFLVVSCRFRLLDPWSFEGILQKALDPEIARSLQDAITTNVRVWV
jgi:hypothetical protein